MYARGWRGDRGGVKARDFGLVAFVAGMIEPLPAPVALVLGSVAIGLVMRRIMPD